jgi:hypothetical protein
MRKPNTGLGFLAVLLFWCGWALTGGTSLAKLEIQKQAKEAGVPAANCQYCHVDKLPKKGESANNERGKWLVSEKDKRKAKDVDGAWLKEYPADKK